MSGRSSSDEAQKPICRDCGHHWLAHPGPSGETVCTECRREARPERDACKRMVSEPLSH